MQVAQIVQYFLPAVGYYAWTQKLRPPSLFFMVRDSLSAPIGFFEESAQFENVGVI